MSDVRTGRVDAIFDHLALGLAADPEATAPAALLSLYAVTWAQHGHLGHLAFLDTGDGARRVVLSDEPALAAAEVARLAPRGWTLEDATRPLVPARFQRDREGTRAVTYRIEPIAVQRHPRIEAVWADLVEPLYAWGPSPRLPDQAIFSTLVEARSAHLAIGDAPVRGVSFRNPVWIPWLGRPLSSALVALGEVLLVPDRSEA